MLSLQGFVLVKVITMSILSHSKQGEVRWGMAPSPGTKRSFIHNSGPCWHRLALCRCSLISVHLAVTVFRSDGPSNSGGMKQKRLETVTNGNCCLKKSGLFLMRYAALRHAQAERGLLQSKSRVVKAVKERQVMLAY